MHLILCCKPEDKDVLTIVYFQRVSKMSGALESYVNRPVSVITADGRNFVGTLKVSKRPFAKANYLVF